VLLITGGRTMRDRFIENNGCIAQTPVESAAAAKSISKLYNWAAQLFIRGHGFRSMDLTPSSQKMAVYLRRLQTRSRGNFSHNFLEIWHFCQGHCK
jgi:hypothetical protein